MAATGLAPTSSLFEGRRPARIPAPPAGGETKKLRVRLQKFSKDDGRGLTDAACEFLAACVASPPGVRTALNRPTIKPTASGYLETIRATVPIDVLTPDPTNGRVVGATAWPAADLEEGQTLKLWAPADMTVHPDSSCEILMMGETADTVKRVVEEAADNTKKLNQKMKAKVERDGVLDPLLCQIAHVQTLDGHTAISLLARDGSTRCSYAKEAHRADAHDALFGAARDPDWRRKRWVEMRRLAEGALDAVTPEQLIELRTFLIDVEIVIGFHTEDPRVSALDAVDDIVRRIHVEVTHPWLLVAQSNSEADQVLGALLSADLIDQEHFLLYGGKLPRSERTARKLPVEADNVLADLMLALGATETRRAPIDQLHGALRAIDARGQVRVRWKAQLAGVLGLRQFSTPAALVTGAHLALGDALSLETLWNDKWRTSSRSPDTLRDAALAELDADGQPGPACRELLVKAAGHMAAQGWLKRESRDPHGGYRDQRPPERVLNLMHRSPQGVHALAEALTAGRRGEQARAVGPDGEPVERVAGDVLSMDNAWLRQTFADAADREKIGPTTEDRAPATASTPREKVGKEIRDIDRFLQEIERALEVAASIADDDGNSYLETHGWATGDADRLAGRMQALAGVVSRYSVIGSLAPAIPPMTQLNLDEPVDAPAELAP